MKFLNSNPARRFTAIKKTGTLYYYGYTNTDWHKICKILDRGNFPTSLKGQFAFVYINGNNWIACVDHLCSTQLFYNDDYIDSNFSKIVEETDDLAEDPDCVMQLKILKAHTVGPDTVYKKIKRVEPETYVKNNRVYKYSDILNEPILPLDIDSVHERFVDVCKIHNLDQATLLFSGGKDSGWLALLLQHLNYDTDFVHIYSDNDRFSIDKNTVKIYERELGLKFKYFDANILPEEPNNIFWKNAQFPTKSAAASTGKGKLKLSGEVGATIGGHLNVFGNLLANNPNIDVDQFIKGFISIQHQWNKKGAQRTIHDDFFKKFIGAKAYEQIFEYFRDKIRNIDQPPAYKYYNFCVNEFNSHRLYAESQDTVNSWFNIFSDYDIQNSFINSRWEDKHSNKIKKLNLYRIGQNKFSNWTDISWRVPVVGMSIPNVKHYRQFNAN